MACSSIRWNRDEIHVSWSAVPLPAISHSFGKTAAFLDLFYSCSNYLRSLQKCDRCDVAARNILIDDDQSAKLCDFTDSAVLSFDVDISEESQDGASIYTNIFQFGSLVYETITGKRFDFDPFHPSDPEGKQGERAIPCWPDKNQLPLIGHLDYDATILKCWSRGFEDMSSVTAEIQTYDRF